MFSAFNCAFLLSTPVYRCLSHCFKWTYSMMLSKNMFKAYRFYVEIASMTNADKYM